MSPPFPDPRPLVAVLLLLASSAPAADSPAGYLATARQALELGLTATAEEAFRAVWADESPRGGADAATAGYNLGLIREKAGDPEAAAGYYRAVAALPERGAAGDAAAARLGIVLASTGKSEEAVPLLEAVRGEQVGGDLAKEAAIALATARVSLMDAAAGANGADSILKEAEAAGKRGEALAHLILARAGMGQADKILPLVKDPGMELLPEALRPAVFLAAGDAVAGSDRTAAAAWYRRAVEASSDPATRVRGAVAALRILLEQDQAGGTASNAGSGSEILGMVPEASVPAGQLGPYLDVKGRFLWTYGRADEGRALLKRSAASCAQPAECADAVLTLIELTGRDGDWARASGEAEAYLAVGARGAVDGRIRWAAAEAAFRAGLWQRAEGHARRLLAETAPFPSRARVTVLLARILAGQGKEQEALALLADVDLGSLPKDEGSAWVDEIVAMRLRAGDNQGILDACGAAGAAGIPLKPATRLARGVALQGLGKTSEAEAALRAEAEEGDAQTRPEASFLLGYLLTVKGKKQEATTAYRRIVDDYPASPRAPESLLMLASLAGDLGQPKQSAEWAAKAVGKLAGADRARALYLLALAEDARKRRKESVAALNRLLKEHAGSRPWSELAEMALAVDAERREDYSAAVALYRKVVEGAEDAGLRAQATERIKLLTPYLKPGGGKKKQ